MQYRTQINGLITDLHRLRLEFDSADTINRVTDGVQTVDIQELESRVLTAENTLKCLLETPDRIGRK